MVRAVASSPTTFRPNSLAAVRRQFGKSATSLVAAANVDTRGARFQAAQLQHQISNAVREALLAMGTNLETYSSMHRDAIPGMSYDRLVRVLRGETQMQLADIVTWAQQFDTVRSLLINDQTWPPALPLEADF
jgi:hypothetical protein